MDFFAAQDQARRNTRWLLVLFGGAVLALILLSNLAIAFGLWMFDEHLFGTWGNVVHAPALDRASPSLGPLAYLSTPLMLGISLGVASTVALASLWKSVQLAHGGRAVAELLDGVLVSPDTSTPARRRLLNSVEELAIAASIPVPPVYVLPEMGINAFAAGHSTDDAVIGITEGALQQLDRDELQGVLGHEFSHILNGDMRLNIRLMALLHGILFIAYAGRVLLQGSRRPVVAIRGRRDSALPVLLVGAALLGIGFAGVLCGRLIKAGVARQREFLADASAVQFTRQSSGLASALSRIGGLQQHGLLRAERAEEASHLLFAQGVATRWFATHPPLEERIRRVDPAWNGRFAAPRMRTGEACETPRDARSSATPAATAIGVAALATAFPGGREEPYPELRAACRDIRSAPAVIIFCLLDAGSDADAAQLALVEQRMPLLAQRVRGLIELAAGQCVDTLALLGLCMPALKQLPGDVRVELWDLVMDLVGLDGRIDLREMVISIFLQRHLVASPGELRAVRARYSRLEQLQGPISLLFSGLAFAVHPGTDEAAQAFARAASATRLDGLRMLDNAAIDWPSLFSGMWRLRAAYPLLKPRIIKGCRAALATDGLPEGQAGELLHLVAAVLDCPAGAAQA
ncbi:MAG: M48 family metallopeptidase [Gammaproteobacteria bacterium]|nr:M48 family metallopeptidase [Gammaproteobacteria bacterium]MBP6051672.1 M48 family metallopeptidase [Pseudomonadales bacterium]MBK6584681.1 M48 family metallopeptidase [Gammaproteobacteria bacterium]MBK7171014.1 M48 family metallopeptidase [Gammaproteobacteria bacterium]MBK7519810.1 M48 family metallopeptidase [Gammaproteobacteria bacterium]